MKAPGPTRSQLAEQAARDAQSARILARINQVQVDVQQLTERQRAAAAGATNPYVALLEADHAEQQAAQQSVDALISSNQEDPYV